MRARRWCRRVSQASVPKISVVVRKAYGAGLYAMDGPGFCPDAALALPQAMIAVMGPEAAVNAVYYNKIQELPEAERPAFSYSGCATNTERTSTSSSSPASWSSTPLCPVIDCGTSYWRGLRSTPRVTGPHWKRRGPSSRCEVVWTWNFPKTSSPYGERSAIFARQRCVLSPATGTAAASFRWRSSSKLGELGLLGMTVPETYGGSALDVLSIANCQRGGRSL